MISSKHHAFFSYALKWEYNLDSNGVEETLLNAGYIGWWHLVRPALAGFWPCSAELGPPNWHYLTIQWVSPAL